MYTPPYLPASLNISSSLCYTPLRPLYTYYISPAAFNGIGSFRHSQEPPPHRIAYILVLSTVPYSTPMFTAAKPITTSSTVPCPFSSTLHVFIVFIFHQAKALQTFSSSYLHHMHTHTSHCMHAHHIHPTLTLLSLFLA